VIINCYFFNLYGYDRTNIARERESSDAEREDYKEISEKNIINQKYL